MKFWTVHIREDKPPELVPEGFAWGAFFFGPLWLFLHRAWIAGLLSLAAYILIGVFTRDWIEAVLLIGLAVWLGVS
ncbi:MAG: hypothetical protein JO212_12600, partial [Acetobacteraceae bacterium]|nr:hypothetical protein [Acetobacteraceae bacterium]